MGGLTAENSCDLRGVEWEIEDEDAAGVFEAEEEHSCFLETGEGDL